MLVPADSAVRQIAAFAVHDPGRAFDVDVAAMADAARAVRVGWVTDGGGEFHAFGDGVARAHGPDPCALGVALAARLLAGGGELVTLVGRDDGLAERVREGLQGEYPGVEVVVYAEPGLGCALEIGVE